MVEALDPTTLQTAAESVLSVLEDAAAEIGWNPPRSCVTPGPVGIDCDSIFVWASNITPIRDQAGPGCAVVLRVTIQYGMGVCVGVSKNGSCRDWEANAPNAHDRAWALQVRLVEAGIAGNLCGNPCSTVRFGDFVAITNDGGYSWWQGSIQIDLSPEELAS